MKQLKWMVIFMVLQMPLAMAEPLVEALTHLCPDCATRVGKHTGAYILEKGEEALISRAWLAQNAHQTIDVQYFIWSTDNIGILAAEALLAAAERGVKVRVLVDDLLVDAKSETLLALAAHPNVEIKIYNPQHSVGVSFWRWIKNLIIDFHGANQRMHDKAVIYDGLVGVTGGRNMADEYFDYDQTYNFRDRDILLIGHAVTQMADNFEEFWQSPLAKNVDGLLGGEVGELAPEKIAFYHQELHKYARDEANFSPQVHKMLNDLPQYFKSLFANMQWGEVTYISDVPGKNNQQEFLTGGSDATTALLQQLQNAQSHVVIQSPYLIIPEGGMAIFSRLRARGVRIQISTNSLASTDNLMAFSGYVKQRDELLALGIELYEFKPHPQIQQQLIARYPALAANNPIFAIHAKSMVIDEKTVFIGTFNFDPRSANLNTEVGALLDNQVLALQLAQSIARDIALENSWKISADFNP
ncbi:MAG: phospholipase D family protein [Marinagarivorans sp.]|nr:phospholipase D family protein [Marinagarivorans sp.]